MLRRGNPPVWLWRRYAVLSVVALCSCGGSSTPPPDPDPFADAGCQEGPSEPTALGVRGQDLWDAFCHEYAFDVRRNGVEAGRFVQGPDTRLTVNVEPLDMPLAGTDACAEVVVAVQVGIESDDDSVSEKLWGTLHGSTENAYINFGTYLMPGDKRVISGTMRFDPELQSFSVSEHTNAHDRAWSFDRDRGR